MQHLQGAEKKFKFSAGTAFHMPYRWIEISVERCYYSVEPPNMDFTLFLRLTKARVLAQTYFNFLVSFLCVCRNLSQMSHTSVHLYFKFNFITYFRIFLISLDFM